jgi:hypothetical protein
LELLLENPTTEDGITANWNEVTNACNKFMKRLHKIGTMLEIQEKPCKNGPEKKVEA